MRWVAANPTGIKAAGRIGLAHLTKRRSKTDQSIPIR